MRTSDSANWQTGCANLTLLTPKKMWAGVLLALARGWGQLLKEIMAFMVMLQKLEETFERIQGDKTLASLQKDESGSAYVPMRVRDIIQETLSPVVWSGQPFLTSSLTRENSKLLQELDKAQELLSQSRKECHELGTKFITVSEKASIPVMRSIHTFSLYCCQDI